MADYSDSDPITVSASGVWDYTKWGSVSDPIHKSDLNGIVGKFGCLQQFRRKKDDRARNTRPRYEKAGGKLISGNAVHAVLARILRSEPAMVAIMGSLEITPAALRIAFDDEFECERKGRDVDWYKIKRDQWKTDCVAMLSGVLRDLPKHVGKVVLAEAGFVYRLGGRDGVWLTGMTDLVYRAPDSTRISLCDWKTGAQRPNQIELDHGWEGGIYSGAVKHAIFVPGENVEAFSGEAHRDAMERVCIEIATAWARVMDGGGQTTITGAADPQETLDALVLNYGAISFGEFPERIRHVHLRDYIPYSRATAKELRRPEELEWAGLQRPERVKFAKGDQRGPAWLRVQRAESDIPRLRYLIDAVVRWVRRGDFVAAPGEMCTRCAYRKPCLSDGYMPVGEELAALEDALGGLVGDSGGAGSDGFDGLEEL